MEFSIFLYMLSIFDESSQICRKYQKKRSLFSCSNILRKGIATAFVFYCDANHSDTLLDSSHVIATCFWLTVVKNGRGFLDYGTIESAVSQESELIKLADSFAF